MSKPDPTVIEIYKDRVREILGSEEKAVFWWKVPNPLLGGVSPETMTARGRFRKVAAFIDEAYADFLAWKKEQGVG